MRKRASKSGSASTGRQSRRSLPVARDELVPENLSACLGAKWLSALAWQAVQSLSWTDVPGESGITLPSQLLLSLLTYCYACGIYSTREILARQRGDATLSSLCFQRDWSEEEVRAFRVRHRPWLRQSLARVLERAWLALRELEPMDLAGTQLQPQDMPWAIRFRHLFEGEAEHRILRAIQSDGPAGE
jgi:hypothetical protein